MLSVLYFLPMKPSYDRGFSYWRLRFSFFYSLFQPPIIVLNVVVIEAENLEAKDANGKFRLFDYLQFLMLNNSVLILAYRLFYPIRKIHANQKKCGVKYFGQNYILISSPLNFKEEWQLVSRIGSSQVFRRNSQNKAIFSSKLWYYLNLSEFMDIFNRFRYSNATFWLVTWLFGVLPGRINQGMLSQLIGNVKVGTEPGAEPLPLISVYETRIPPLKAGRIGCFMKISIQI